MILLSCTKDLEFTFLAPDNSSERNLLFVFGRPGTLEVDSQTVHVRIKDAEIPDNIPPVETVPELCTKEDYRGMTFAQQRFVSNESNKRQYAGFRFQSFGIYDEMGPPDGIEEFNDAFMLHDSNAGGSYVDRIALSTDSDDSQTLGLRMIYADSSFSHHRWQSGEHMTNLTIHGDKWSFHEVMKIDITIVKASMGAIEETFVSEIGVKHKEPNAAIDGIATAPGVAGVIERWTKTFYPPPGFPALAGVFGSIRHYDHLRTFGVVWGSRDAVGLKTTE